MPDCPKCGSTFPAGTEFCPKDGEVLKHRDQDMGVAATAYGPADVRDTSPEAQADEGDAADRADRAGDRAGARPSTDPPPRPSDLPSDLIGQVLGGVYKVIDQLGVGGMGVVFRVEHTNLQKEFALKILGQVAQDHPDAVERFRQEAVSASRIEHDNIVDIITLDQTNEGHFYIVMELLRGESLADVIQTGAPLPLDRALPMVYQICQALHAAHEAGIIHRDLKPENVFVTHKGEAEFVKILDFGISKIHAAEQDRVRITRTGHVLGTPLYMSPEQAKGKSNLDRRVDIYSLGVILFEMLEGYPPFEGENYFQLIWKHSNEEPPPLRGDAPERLKEVVLRTLSKEPDNRPANMLELEEALLEAVPDIPPPPFLLDFRPSIPSSPERKQATPRSGRSQRPLILAALGAGAVAAVVVALAWPRGPAGGEEQTDDAQEARLIVPTDSGPSSPGRATVEAGLGRDGGDDAAPEPPATMVTLSIRSTPPGAEAFLGDESLGRTPLDLEREENAAELELRLIKRGFVTVRQRVTLDRDVELVVPLSQRRRNVRRPPETTGPTVPIKTTF